MANVPEKFRQIADRPQTDIDWIDCPVCAAPFGGCDHTDEQKAAALRGEPVQTSVLECAACGVRGDEYDIRQGPGGDWFCATCFEMVGNRLSLYEVEARAVRRATFGEPDEGEQLPLLPDRSPSKPTRAALPLAAFVDQVAGQPKPPKSFVDSIQRYGQLTPVIVRKTATGYVLADGRRRVMALIWLAEEAGEDLGAATVQADVYSAADWSHDEVISLIANQHRSPNVVSEMEAIEALVEQGYSVKQICEATGLRKQTVERRLRMTNLEPDLRMALRLGRIAPGVAEQIAKLPLAVQAERLVPLLATQHRITGRDVANARRVQIQAATDTLFDLGDFDTPGAGDLAGAPDAAAPNPLGDLMTGLLRGDLDEQGRIRLERAVRSLQVNYQSREGLIRNYQRQYVAIRRAMQAAGVPLDTGWQMDTAVKRVLADRALLIDAIQAALSDGVHDDTRQMLSRALAQVGVEGPDDR